MPVKITKVNIFKKTASFVQLKSQNPKTISLLKQKEAYLHIREALFDKLQFVNQLNISAVFPPVAHILDKMSVTATCQVCSNEGL